MVTLTMMMTRQAMMQHLVSKKELDAVAKTFLRCDVQRCLTFPGGLWWWLYYNDDIDLKPKYGDIISRGFIASDGCLILFIVSLDSEIGNWNEMLTYQENFHGE